MCVSQRPDQRKSAACVCGRCRGCGEISAKQLHQAVPKKWERLGDLALLPASAFSNLAVWSDAAVQLQLWPLVASALKVQRLARQVYARTCIPRHPGCRAMFVR